jgi:hypothetical protein
LNEYYSGRLAIDVINGGPALLREWVDESEATPQVLDGWSANDGRLYDPVGGGLSMSE